MVTYGPDRVGRLHKALLKKAGITENIRFHDSRRTYATLIKRVDAPEKDKLELIGHTDGEMLRYYQDVDFADLRRITDVI